MKLGRAPPGLARCRPRRARGALTGPRPHLGASCRANKCSGWAGPGLESGDLCDSYTSRLLQGCLDPRQHRNRADLSGAPRAEHLISSSRIQHRIAVREAMSEREQPPITDHHHHHEHRPIRSYPIHPKHLNPKPETLGGTPTISKARKHRSLFFSALASLPSGALPTMKWALGLRV